jgi:LDH2 family malate/lactate/ureidoglycolate dehydrogenase
MMSPSELPRRGAEVLERALTRVLVARGTTAEHAGWVSRALVETSLRGVDTHGIALFPTYLHELEGGRAAARPVLRWHGEGKAICVLDAGGALGVVAGHVAADRAAVLARDHGLGAVAVRNSNHFGAAGAHALRIADRGLLGLCFSNSDALVAPLGGLRPLFGTNPVSVALRGHGDELLCVDMATSQSSYTRIKQRRERGLPIEPRCAVGRDGRDSSETGDVAALQPLGGHKGQCLSMVVELLCTLVTGAPLDHELSHLYEPPYDAPRNVGHLVMAIDLGQLDGAAGFASRLGGWLAAVRAQPTRGDAGVLVPGDLERAAHHERARDGIPIDPSLLRVLHDITGDPAFAAP